MIGIGVAETVPVLSWRHRPALSFINLFRLPDIKEPAVRLFSQPLYLFTEVQRAFDRAIDQSTSGITAQHGRGGLD